MTAEMAAHDKLCEQQDRLYYRSHVQHRTSHVTARARVTWPSPMVAFSPTLPGVMSRRRMHHGMSVFTLPASFITGNVQCYFALHRDSFIASPATTEAAEQYRH